MDYTRISGFTRLQTHSKLDITAHLWVVLVINHIYLQFVELSIYQTWSWMFSGIKYRYISRVSELVSDSQINVTRKTVIIDCEHCYLLHFT